MQEITEDAPTAAEELLPVSAAASSSDEPEEWMIQVDVEWVDSDELEVFHFLPSQKDEADAKYDYLIAIAGNYPVALGAAQRDARAISMSVFYPTEDGLGDELRCWEAPWMASSPVSN